MEVIIDPDEVWEYIMTHIKFDKSKITKNIESLFKNNMDLFGR